MELMIPDKHLTSFVACLALGTLHAIRTGSLAPQAGIWTLGRPEVRYPLANNPSIPRELIDVLNLFDELSAMQKLVPDHYNTELDRLIDQLNSVLSKVDNPFWNVRWKLEDDHPPQLE